MTLLERGHDKQGPLICVDIAAGKNGNWSKWVKHFKVGKSTVSGTCSVKIYLHFELRCTPILALWVKLTRYHPGWSWHQRWWPRGLQTLGGSMRQRTVRYMSPAPQYEFFEGAALRPCLRLQLIVFWRSLHRLPADGITTGWQVCFVTWFGWLGFGCSTMVSTCSARFLPFQADSATTKTKSTQPCNKAN